MLGDKDLLLPVDSEERLKVSQQVWDKLNHISRETEQYIRELDNVENESNCYSDLSDPFSDMGDGNEFVKARNKKRLSKLESDILLMSSFTSEFMKVQETMLRDNAEMKTEMCAENLGSKQYEYLVDVPVEVDERIKNMVDEMLDSCGMKSPKRIETPKPKGMTSPDGKNVIGKSPLSDVNETNSLSGVWRMLEAQSTSNGFPVSPIGYNVFDDKRLEWLKRESSSWNEHEATRQKCEEWLKKI